MKMTSLRYTWLTAIMSIATIGGGVAWAWAQPPGEIAKVSNVHEEVRTTEKPMKAKGKIVSFHENKHGDVDGFLLSDDTTVKFPPHMGESLVKELKIGIVVSVNGRRHETPKGEVHLHAVDITANGNVHTIDSPKPPKHDQGHERGHADWMTKKQADEMLSELRAIRKLMEERVK